MKNIRIPNSNYWIFFEGNFQCVVCSKIAPFGFDGYGKAEQETALDKQGDELQQYVLTRGKMTLCLIHASLTEKQQLEAKKIILEQIGPIELLEFE